VDTEIKDSRDHAGYLKLKHGFRIEAQKLVEKKTK